MSRVQAQVSPGSNGIKTFNNGALVSQLSLFQGLPDSLKLPVTKLNWATHKHIKDKSMADGIINLDFSQSHNSGFLLT